MSCGTAAVVGNAQSVFTPYKEGEDVPNPALPQEMFFDVSLSYTCGEGYSTDGSAAEAAKEFSVRCTETGDATPVGSCQKIRCDNYQMPLVPNANAFNVKDTFFVYKDVVRFQCHEGFTETGRVGGTVDFSVECQATGDFTAPSSCSPVKCPDPAVQANSAVSPDRGIQFTGDAQYSCLAGYESKSGETVFGMSCMADGAYSKKAIKANNYKEGLSSETECPQNKAIETQEECQRAVLALELVEDGFRDMNLWVGRDTEKLPGCAFDSGAEFNVQFNEIPNTAASGNGKILCYDDNVGTAALDPPVTNLLGAVVNLERCLPVSCGTAPDVAHATFQGFEAMTGVKTSGTKGSEFTYDMALLYTCDEGYTIDGTPAGQTQWTVTCGADKAKMGDGQTCDEILYPLTGKVADATSQIMGGFPLATASVTAYARNPANGQYDVRAASSRTGVDGLYNLGVKLGEYRVTADLAGYIMVQRQVTVTGAIVQDLAQSPILLPNEYRAVLRWTGGANLDLIATFGKAENCMVSYSRTSVAVCEGTPMTAAHETDSAAKGPESVKISGVGDCNALQGACTIRVYVKDRSGEDLPNQDALVTLYKGSEEVGKWKFPDYGDSKLWPVLTIDASEGADTVVHDGLVTLCPYVSSDGEEDWGEALETVGWATLPQNSLMTGIWRAEHESLSNLDIAAYDTLGDTMGLDCLDLSWAEEFNDPGAVDCAEGYFIAGLYRTGGTQRIESGDAGIHQIDMARCCKPREAAATWNQCEDVTWNFGESGWAKCPANKFVAGLHRSIEAGLSGITKGKCCAYSTADGCGVTVGVNFRAPSNAGGGQSSPGGQAAGIAPSSQTGAAVGAGPNVLTKMNRQVDK